MTTPDEQKTGALVQAYVKAKLGNAPNETEADNLAVSLDPQLKERVDILGFEGETLLNVAADEVLSMLARLENQAAREDARVHKTATRVQAREVRKQGKPRAADNVRPLRKAAPRQAHVSTARSGRQRHR